MKYQTGTSSP